MELSRQEYWSGLPFPPTGYLPDPWIKSASLTLADGFFSTVPPGKSVLSFSLVSVQFSSSIMSDSLQPHRLQTRQTSLVYHSKKKKKYQLLVLLNFFILFISLISALIFVISFLLLTFNLVYSFLVS